MSYRGTLKHKQWKPRGGYGTLCPKWTHQAGNQGFAGNPDAHPWKLTAAYELLQESEEDELGHRYAARRGIAFKAQMSNDGTWHGYPIPWEDVPASIQAILIDQGKAFARDMKRQKSIDTRDIRWALKSDED